ncbi:hypothetical protein [Siccibacter colletis]|uniref:Uncharacterized protein n=1 Tax=Siccibacter colletis TaxID=1505757 RepID=A0ABY6JJQ3_9ENTR|nr:hypothetical protein KFZ77_13335 [Siccibacter colletis]
MKLRNTVYILALLAVVATPSHAISAKYRAQLERSGCTQITELQGCDIHQTKMQNTNTERQQISAFLRDSVLNQPTDAAYEALNGYGFTNPAPLKWVKGKYAINLTINQKDVVTHATVTP